MMATAHRATRASTLQDFKPLSPAEQIVLRAARTGDIATLGYRRPRDANPAVGVRGAFLAFLALGGGEGARVHGPQLQVVGARIVGRIDLACARVPMGLWLYRCTLGSAPVLDGARISGSVSFSGCSLPALHAQACQIDGDLSLNARCKVEGEVMLAHAHVRQNLNLAHLRDGNPDAPLAQRIVANGVRVGGDVILDEAEIVGESCFLSARILGDFRAVAARLTADLDESGSRGVALRLDRARIGGSVRLNDGFSAAGQVSLRRTRIDSDLDCCGALFDAAGDVSWGEFGSPLVLDRARVGGSLILRKLQSPLQGASLADARVRSLLDDGATWGQHHVLDGFAYQRFAGSAATDSATRLAWLTRQSSTHLGNDFRPEPWRRLIRVLRRMGREPSAREVAIGREQHMRRAGLIGRGAPLGARWLVQLAHAFFGGFAGYGYRPLRLVATAGALWLLCSGAYWAAAEQGALAPSAALSAANPRLESCLPECDLLPKTAPRFQPFIYSIEMLVPLIDLQQRRHWAPVRNATAGDVEQWTGVSPLLALTWFEGLCGWIVTLTLFAMLTGLTDRDRRR
ncbi:MAG: hypothetical protein ABIQ60_14805 [Burkholderiaceae bacterium]